MRAWTILIFIISLQAALAMLNVADPMNAGLGISIDTTNPNAIVVSQTQIPIAYPQPDPNFYTVSGTKYNTSIKDYSSTEYISGTIADITKIISAFESTLKLFWNMLNAIYYTSHTYIGDFNAGIIQGLVDVVLGIALLQIFSGRSFKTAE